MRGISRKATVVGLAALLVAMVSTNANAGFVSLYSNFGGLGALWDPDGYFVSGPASYVSNQVIAMPFTVDATGQVDWVKLALSHYSDANASLSLSLVSDAEGTPGTIIETFTTQSNPAISYWMSDDHTTRTGGGMVAFESALHPILDAGTTYWLIAVEPSSGVDLVWHCTYAPYGYSATFGFNRTGSATGPWNYATGTMTAFAVEGQTVPDPGSTLLLGGIAMAALAAVRRRLTSPR